MAEKSPFILPGEDPEMFGLLVQEKRRAGDLEVRVEVLEAALSTSQSALAKAEGEQDEAQRRQREVFERGAKIDGKGVSPVWLERSVGANFLWVVWALKPGQVRLIAITSDEAKADHYSENLPPGLTGFRSFKERAPIDHSFGFADSFHARVQGKL